MIPAFSEFLWPLKYRHSKQMEERRGKVLENSQRGKDSPRAATPGIPIPNLLLWVCRVRQWWDGHSSFLAAWKCIKNLKFLCVLLVRPRHSLSPCECSFLGEGRSRKGNFSEEDFSVCALMSPTCCRACPCSSPPASLMGDKETSRGWLCGIWLGGKEGNV